MMALPFSGHGVTLGGLSLVDWGQPVTHDEGYTFEISADGTTWGNPQVVVSSLISALSDGEIVQQQRAGNREPVLYVRITGADHFGLVAGDTALGAVVGKPCELVWQPPDPDAPPTVIDVVHSRMDHQWDDMDALKFQRVWVITMSALPWPRSAEKVITPAIATTSTTVVNDGSSAVGWTSDGVVATASGAVVTTYPAGGGGIGLRLAGSIDTSTQKYIAIDWKSSVPVYHGFWVNDSFAQPPEARREPLAGGYTRSWYKVGDSQESISSLSFVVVHQPNATTATLSIDLVQKAATLPASGTARQLTRTVDPEGNVPAEGSIIVQHETAGLGQVLIYTHPLDAGYSPPLRRWLLATDPITADPDNISGARNSIGNVARATIPAASVPQGDVHLWVRLHKNAGGAGTVNVNWAARSAQNAQEVGAAQTGTTACYFPAQDAWTLFPLARLTLPTARIGSAGFVTIELTADSGTVVLDEAWLFAMDKGRLTVVDCGSGTPAHNVSNRLRIEAPSLDEPFGSILVARDADWSNAYTPAAETVLCPQTGHRFDPDGSMIHVVTSGVSTEASVSLEHYPRWRAEAS